MDSGPPSQIYFAENLSSYVLTGAEQAEFNYQREGATDQFTRYKGKDGVRLSNFVRRAAFALRFGSLDPLISGQINSSTKLLMERDIRSRVDEARAVPAVRCRSLPGGARRPHGLDHGRLHHDRQYPYCQALGGDGSLTDVVQLRAQLGEGHRRRVRGHGHVLRVRQEGPDHPGLRGGVPRPLHRRRRACPRRSARTCATPRTSSSRRRRCSVGTTSPSRSGSMTAAPIGWSRPTPARDGCRATSFSEATAVAGSARRHRATTSRRPRRRPAPASIRTTSTSGCRGRQRRALHRAGALRAGVVGQQPDAPRVVPRRRLRSRASTASCSRSRCRRVRPSKARYR